LEFEFKKVFFSSDTHGDASADPQKNMKWNVEGKGNAMRWAVE
jgi:hypothetical protein